MPTAPISTAVSAVLARTVSPEMHQLLTMTTLVTTKSQLSLQQKLQLRLKKQQPPLLHRPQLLLNQPLQLKKQPPQLLKQLQPKLLYSIMKLPVLAPTMLSTLVTKL
jgi:hypothetical protein